MIPGATRMLARDALRPGRRPCARPRARHQRCPRRGLRALSPGRRRQRRRRAAQRAPPRTAGAMDALRSAAGAPRRGAAACACAGRGRADRGRRGAPPRSDPPLPRGQPRAIPRPRQRGGRGRRSLFRACALRAFGPRYVRCPARAAGRGRSPSRWPPKGRLRRRREVRLDPWGRAPPAAGPREPVRAGRYQRSCRLRARQSPAGAIPIDGPARRASAAPGVLVGGRHPPRLPLLERPGSQRAGDR